MSTPVLYTLPYSSIDGLFSEVQLSEHYLLYKGYYDQTLSLPGQINGVGTSANPASIRGLQKTLQYALSGRELHELYFDLVSPSLTTVGDMGPELIALLEKSFGSVEQFLSDMLAASVVSRGWYRLEYDPRYDLCYHNVGDFHDEGSTSGFTPLLAIDMYDHAYFYDYQTRKKEYASNYISHINWKQVTARLKRV